MIRRDFLQRAGAALAAAAVVPAAGCTLSDERDNGAVSGSAPPPDRPDTAPPSGNTYASWDDVRQQFSLSPDKVHMSALLIASHPRPVKLPSTSTGGGSTRTR